VVGGGGVRGWGREDKGKEGSSESDFEQGMQDVSTENKERSERSSSTRKLWRSDRNSRKLVKVPKIQVSCRKKVHKETLKVGFY
jgi:hypothetical protein